MDHRQSHIHQPRSRWLLMAATLLLALLAALPVAWAGGDNPASRHAMGDGWDPEVPGQPGGVPEYRLTLIGEPAGYFNYPRESKHTAGTPLDIHAYDSDGYHFIDFTVDGEVVSTEPNYSIVMPAHPLTITAHYYFDPSQPDDPNQTVLKRHLTVTTVPENTCGVNWSTGIVDVGTTLDIRTYPNNGFKPVKIEINGHTYGEGDENPSASWRVTKEEHVDVVVYAEYDPEPPTLPGRNYWDPETGEMIIDYLQTNHVMNEIDALLARTGHSREDVKRLRVCTEYDDLFLEGDYAALSALPALEVADLSHVHAYSTLSSNALKNIKAKEVMLSHMHYYNSYVFEGAEQMRHLTLIQTTPPEATSYTFARCDSIYERCVLHVPRWAIATYRSTAPWSNFKHIEPLDENFRTLTLSLPAEDVDMYRGYTIELINTRNAQRRTMMVDGSTDYTFSTISAHEPFALRLLTSSGFEAARLEDIAPAGGELTVSFDSIAPLRSLTARVLAEGQEVTGSCLLTWQIASDIDGKPVTVGTEATISGVPEGTEIECLVKPNDQLARLYESPVRVGATAGEADSAIDIALTALGETELSGTVVDGEGQELNGAKVTVSQSVNGCTPRSITAETDGQGRWSATIKRGSGDVYVTYSAPWAESATDTIGAEQLSGSALTLGAKTLNVVGGATLSMAINITEASEPGTSAISHSLDDAQHLRVSVYDRTQERALPRVEMDYPELRIVDGDIQGGDVLTVRLWADDDSFAETEAQVSLNRSMKGTLRTTLMRHGAIKAVVSADDAKRLPAAVVYDAEGQPKAWKYYEGGEALFEGLPEGNYSVATFEGSLMPKVLVPMANIAEIMRQQECELTEVNVTDAVVTTAQCSILKGTPTAERGWSNHLTLEQPKVHTGGIATLKMDMNHPNSIGSNPGRYIYVMIPKGCSLIDGTISYNRLSKLKILSVFTGQTYTEENVEIEPKWDEETGMLMIRIYDTEVNGLQASLCVKADAPGEYYFYAENRLTAHPNNMDRGESTQPIGNAVLTVTDMDISVAPLTATADITVAGICGELEDVSVYDGNELIGQTKADQHGYWQMEATLTSEGSHTIKARTADRTGATTAEAQATCVYDRDAVVPQMTTMSLSASLKQGQSDVHFDFAHNQIAEDYYVPGNDYMGRMSGAFDDPAVVLNTQFNDASRVTSATVHVLTHDGAVRHLPAYADAIIGGWTAVAPFDGEALPINISLSYTMADATDEISYGGDSGAYFADPVWPETVSAGFVYEGDYNHRIEGVRATLLQKQVTRDEYGDMVVEATPWEATGYGQQNPQYTDAQGRCTWQVPEGEWQVRYEKAGYETVTTEWTKLPASMLKQNISMRRLNGPKVTGVTINCDTIFVAFDQPVRSFTSGLYYTRESLILCNDSISQGYYPMGNRDSQGEMYDVLTVFPPSDFVWPGDEGYQETYLIVTHEIENYAGMQMEADYITPLPERHKIHPMVLVSNDGPAGVGFEYQVEVIGIEPGMQMTLSTSNDRILSLTDTHLTADTLGVARTTVKALRIGEAKVMVKIDGGNYTDRNYGFDAWTTVQVDTDMSALFATDSVQMMVGEEQTLKVQGVPGTKAEGIEVSISISDDNAEELAEDEEADEDADEDAEEAEPGIELSCGDSLRIGKDGNGQCRVRALKAGEYTITWSYDNGYHVLTDQTHVTIDDYILGDANGDGVVSVTDITTLVMHIMEQQPDIFVEHAADANGDGVVSVSDITEIVTMIMTDSWRPESSRAAAEGMLSMSEVSIDESGMGVGEIGLHGAKSVMGVQMDIDVPAGMRVADVQPTEANIGAGVAWSEVAPGRVRVLAYSTNAKALNGERLIDVIFATEGSVSADATVSLSPALWAMRDGSAVSEHSAAGSSATVKASTGIADAESGDEVRVSAEGHTVVVVTATDRLMVMSDSAGRYRVIHAKAGENRIHVAESGVIMIAGKKLLIK